MKPIEGGFEADKIQAAIDYLEYKGVLNRIKAQAIEEAVKEEMSGSDDPMVKAYANIMRHHANKLRGE